MRTDMVGVLIGRFQSDDLHDGHCKILNTIYENHEDVIIFLGVPSFPSKTNPLDFFTRKKMLSIRYPSAIIEALHDRHFDEDWSKEIDRRVKEIFPFRKAKLYGGRDNCLLHYKGKLPYEGIEVKKDMSDISSSKRRLELANITGTTPEFRHGVIYGAENRYPQVMPTVDVAILYLEDTKVKLILGQKPEEPFPRFIGGFVDTHDHSMEHTACREVKEETGINAVCGNLHIVGTQRIDDWRVTAGQSIMTTFFVVTTDATNVKAAKAADDIEHLVHISWKELCPERLMPEHKKLCEVYYSRITQMLEQKRIVF